MANDSERRKFYRHPVHVPLKVELEKASGTSASTAADVSLGGLSFLWNEKLPKGEKVRLSIGIKERHFDVRGKVVYSVGDPRSGKYRNGITFIDTPSAFKARLAEEVFKIIDYRRSLIRQLGREVSEEEAAQMWIAENGANFSF
jgi:c-di-GMP-binding flagellar brake protein YcgR